MNAQLLRIRAQRLLKLARIPESGPLFNQALGDAEGLGSLLAHHAAWLLHYAGKLEKVAAAPGEEAGMLESISQAIEAGRHLASAEAARQGYKMPPMTEEEGSFMAAQVRRRDKELGGSARANAARAKKPDWAKYDLMVNAGKTQAEIAEALETTEVTLRKWRKERDRAK